MSADAPAPAAPRKFRTRLCLYGAKCPYGPERCLYAHSEAELRLKGQDAAPVASTDGSVEKRIEASMAGNLKYKTVACRHWNESGGTFCPVGRLCQYAHGEQELAYFRAHSAALLAAASGSGGGSPDGEGRSTGSPPDSNASSPPNTSRQVPAGAGSRVSEGSASAGGVLGEGLPAVGPAASTSSVVGFVISNTPAVGSGPPVALMRSSGSGGSNSGARGGPEEGDGSNNSSGTAWAAAGRSGQPPLIDTRPPASGSGSSAASAPHTGRSGNSDQHGGMSEGGASPHRGPYGAVSPALLAPQAYPQGYTQPVQPYNQAQQSAAPSFPGGYGLPSPTGAPHGGALPGVKIDVPPELAAALGISSTSVELSQLVELTQAYQYQSSLRGGGGGGGGQGGGLVRPQGVALPYPVAAAAAAPAPYPAAAMPGGGPYGSVAAPHAMPGTPMLLPGQQLVVLGGGGASPLAAPGGGYAVLGMPPGAAAGLPGGVYGGYPGPHGAASGGASPHAMPGAGGGPVPAGGALYVAPPPQVIYLGPDGQPYLGAGAQAMGAGGPHPPYLAAAAPAGPPYMAYPAAHPHPSLMQGGAAPGAYPPHYGAPHPGYMSAYMPYQTAGAGVGGGSGGVSPLPGPGAPQSPAAAHHSAHPSFRAAGRSDDGGTTAAEAQLASTFGSLGLGGGSSGQARAQERGYAGSQRGPSAAASSGSGERVLVAGVSSASRGSRALSGSEGTGIIDASATAAGEPPMSFVIGGLNSTATRFPQVIESSANGGASGAGGAGAASAGGRPSFRAAGGVEAAGGLSFAPAAAATAAPAPPPAAPAGGSLPRSGASDDSTAATIGTTPSNRNSLSLSGVPNLGALGKSLSANAAPTPAPPPGLALGASPKFTSFDDSVLVSLSSAHSTASTSEIMTLLRLGAGAAGSTTLWPSTGTSAPNSGPSSARSTGGDGLPRRPSSDAVNALVQGLLDGE